MLNVTFQKMKVGVITVLWRFPLATASNLFLTLVALNSNSLPPHWHIPALITIFIIGVLWFIFIKILSESYNWNGWILTSIGLFVFGVMGVYIYNLIYVPSWTMLIGPALILLPMVAPFLRKTVKKEMIWQFHYRLWSQFFFSLLASVIFILGIALLLFSLYYLFHLRLPDWMYPKLMIITACFIFPLMVMACIPSQFDEMPAPQQGKGIRFLLDYIMAPILLVYGAIIISYALKILVLQNLPRGEVSFLVSALGGTGLLAYILGENDKKAISMAHQVFRTHFFHLMIIPLILMGIGISVRIHQYGITRLRYVDGLFFFWLCLCVLHSFIRPRERFAQFMFVSAVSLLLLGSFGPWGIEEMSARSQVRRLQNILEKNNILTNNSIQKVQSPINQQDQYEISSILDSLIKTGQIDTLKVWFGPQADKIFNIPNKHLISPRDLTNLMGVQLESSEPRKISFEYNPQTPWYSVNGYEYIIPHVHIYPNSYSDVENQEQAFTLPNSEITLIIKFEESTQTLILKRQGASSPLINVSIAELVRTLGGKTSHPDLDKSLTFEGVDASLKARLIVQNIRGNLSLEPKSIQYMNVMLLVKSVAN